MASNAAGDPTIEIPSELVKKVARRRCVLFVGAGLSKATHELPLWDELIEVIYNSLDPGRLSFSLDDANANKLEFLDWAYQQGKAAFNVELLNCLRLQSNQAASLDSSNVHRMLVRLPWAAIVTSNFDTLIERAFDDERLPKVLVARDTDLPNIALGEGTLLLKLHGTADDESERVLTASEYRRFKTSRQSVSAEFVALLSKYPMLIVGASVTDPNFQNLYDIAYSALGGFKHPCYYLTRRLPEFLRDVWKARGFEYLELPTYDIQAYQRWIQRLVDSVREKEAQSSAWRSRTNVTWFAKEASLKAMGSCLGNYEGTHAVYTQTIHSPDCVAFHEFWERTLYQPVRDLVLRFAPRNRFRLLYVGPGPHVPLLAGEGSRVAQRVREISLIDIDDRVLSAAERSARALGIQEVRTEKYDITEGAGGQLARTLENIAQGDDGDTMMMRLKETSGQMRSWFSSSPPRTLSTKQLADAAVSEMVASFTAVPSLMAFRSRVGGIVDGMKEEDRGRFETTLALLCATFNEIVFKRHLAWLARRVRPEGRVIVVADTAKVFQQEDVAERPVFPKARFPILRGSTLREFDIERTDREFYWLDHPFPVIPEGAGMLSDEFRPHSHRIRVAVYQVEP
jgi:hypothetical protein